MQDQTEAIDLSQSPVEEQGQVRSLLTQYTPVFSAYDRERKNDGSLLMCEDCRQINNKTRKDAFPLPHNKLSRWQLTKWVVIHVDHTPRHGTRHISRTPWVHWQVHAVFHDGPSLWVQLHSALHLGYLTRTTCPLGFVTPQASSRNWCNEYSVTNNVTSLLLNVDYIVDFSSTVEQHLEKLEVVLGRFRQERPNLHFSGERCATWAMWYRTRGFPLIQVR